jgi:hypothetical protein
MRIRGVGPAGRLTVAGFGERTRSAAIKTSNLKIVSAARSLRFADEDAIPLLCECGNRQCQEFVPRSARAYEALNEAGEWLLATGHIPDPPT